MKNKLFFALTIFILVQSKIDAQEEYFKPGSEWYYSSGYGLLQLRGHSMYKYISDTIINGYPLKKISRTFYSFDLDDPTVPLDTFYHQPRFFMQSGDSIYSYDNGRLTLQWINGLDAGDIFEIDEEWDTLGNWDVYTMIVDSVDTVTIDGIETRKMYIHGGVIDVFWGDTIFTNLSGHEIIYEKFGPVSGWGYWVCWGFYDCGPGTLCRYSSDETGRIDINTGQQCETLLTASKEIISGQLNLFPNPVSDILTIVVDEIYILQTNIQFFNLTGVPVFTTKVDERINEIDVSFLPQGVYFCTVRHENGIRIFKFLKI